MKNNEHQREKKDKERKRKGEKEKKRKRFYNLYILEHPATYHGKEEEERNGRCFTSTWEYQSWEL